MTRFVLDVFICLFFQNLPCRQKCTRKEKRFNWADPHAIPFFTWHFSTILPHCLVFSLIHSGIGTTGLAWFVLLARVTWKDNTHITHSSSQDTHSVKHLTIRTTSTLVQTNHLKQLLYFKCGWGTKCAKKRKKKSTYVF